ncbi:MAG: hypothetical protein EOP59_06130 [Sphingomonadales bacterium]|nr:MAG: hypothetical protein EOP59_06130 [Sphingomonadales bacterium]
MTRMIKDYIQVADHESLDSLIAQLSALRDSLGDGADAEVAIRGDAVFGRHISIAFMRPLTAEEAACEGRYAEPRMRRAA